MSEPTKRDVLELGDYLGCNGEELWSEVSKLLKQQNDYAIQAVALDLLKDIEEYSLTATEIKWQLEKLSTPNKEDER